MTTFDTLAVYLGSSGYARPVFKEGARALGAMIGRTDKRLVYGGMDTGLMGLLAQSAMENGAHVTGIIPLKLKDSERILQGLSETLLVEELCDRKKRMFLLADAVLVLPGGFGTADEALEILYWGGLKMHQKPVLFINLDGYWDDLTAYLRGLPDFDPAYFIEVPSLDAVFPALENWTPPPGPDTDRIVHYPHFEDEICRDTDEPIIIDRPSIENSYYALCALGLRQLGKHGRGVGFLNTDGQFDTLAHWIERAAAEKFITGKCLSLFRIAEKEELLRVALKGSGEVHIDLHKEKWGEEV